MYNHFKNKGIEENSVVKIKQEDFENMAKSNGIFNLEKFYQSEFFNTNFIPSVEFINGIETRFINKEI